METSEIEKGYREILFFLMFFFTFFLLTQVEKSENDVITRGR